jgi:WD40 repeat protein
MWTDTMQTLQAHKGKVRALDFSADGAYLASAGASGAAVSLWHLPDWKRSYRKGDRGVLVAVRFAPRGNTLVASHAGHIALWADALEEKNPTIVRQGEQVAFSADGRQFAYLEPLHRGPGQEMSLEFASSATGNLIGGCPLPTNHTTHLLAGSPVAHVFGVTTSATSFRQASVQLVRPDAATPVTGPLVLEGFPYAITFSSDGLILAVSNWKAIHRWDVATATPLPSLRGHKRAITGVAALPDGRLLSCSVDGTVRTWDGTKCVDVKEWGLGELTALAVARDGMRAAVGSKSGTILIWDLD